MPDTTTGGLPYPIVGDPVVSWPETNEDLAYAVESHRATITRSTAQTVATGAAVTLDVDGSAGVVGLTVSLAANTITLTRDGFYMIAAGNGWAADNNGRRIMLLMVNGTEIARHSSSPGGGTPGHTMAWGGVLNAGDVIRLDIYQDSGGNVDTRAGTSFLTVAQVT